MSLTINGQQVDRTVEPRMLLAEFLREELRLTGTHVGCDTTQCGCCTIHLDGRPVKSCTVLALQCEGREVRTVEGLAEDDGPLHPMQQAFSECHALQCGFCTPGMIMAAIGVVDRDPKPDSATIRHGLEGNICRCTGYLNIEKAVIQGAKAMSELKGG